MLYMYNYQGIHNLVPSMYSEKKKFCERFLDSFVIFFQFIEQLCYWFEASLPISVPETTTTSRFFFENLKNKSVAVATKSASVLRKLCHLGVTGVVLWWVVVSSYFTTAWRIRTDHSCLFLIYIIIYSVKLFVFF